MHAERDHLVFPALEERLRARAHHLAPIDLRLGVETAGAPDEGAPELLALEVCLGEIERTRMDPATAAAYSEAPRAARRPEGAPP